MPTLFMDEAGFTGANWLDAAQPVFVLASLKMEENEAEVLKARYFAHVQADELKFASIGKRPSHQQGLLGFLDDLLSRPSAIATTYVVKRFALVAKMVDTIVETVAYATGDNLYEGAGHKRLTNALYFGIPKLAGEVFFQDLLARFQALARKPSDESYDAFFYPLVEIHHTGKLGELLQWLALGHRAIGRKTMQKLLEGEPLLDLATPSVMSLVGFWSATQTGLVVVHDSSSKLAKDKAIWEAYSNAAASPTEIPWTGGTVKYPLPVQEFRFEEVSNAWAGLQLADLIAGALAHAYPKLHTPRGELSAFEASLLSRVGQLRTVFAIAPGDVESVFSGKDSQRIIDYGVDLRRSIRGPKGGE